MSKYVQLANKEISEGLHPSAAIYHATVQYQMDTGRSYHGKEMLNREQTDKLNAEWKSDYKKMTEEVAKSKKPKELKLQPKMPKTVRKQLGMRK